MEGQEARRGPDPAQGKLVTYAINQTSEEKNSVTKSTGTLLPITFENVQDHHGQLPQGLLAPQTATPTQDHQVMAPPIPSSLCWPGHVSILEFKNSKIDTCPGQHIPHTYVWFKSKSTCIIELTCRTPAAAPPPGPCGARAWRCRGGSRAPWSGSS